MLPTTQTEPATPALAFLVPGARETTESLSHAFEWFSSAAASLEQSYVQLQSEVTRLRGQLERKSAELDAERDRAQRMRALAETSAILAHEIRNPLAGMELFADLLLESGELGRDCRNWTMQLQAGLRTLTATVNNVLELHADPGPLQNSLNPGDLVASTIEFLNPIAEQLGVAVCFEDWSSGMFICGDENRLRQVFLNLAMNAFQAMPSGGELMFSVSPSAGGRKVRVRVRDSGSGIAPENLGRIFEAGFTSRRGGVGLGLAVCRKIVEQHGGNIGVESELGKGTTVVVSFPTI